MIHQDLIKVLPFIRKLEWIHTSVSRQKLQRKSWGGTLLWSLEGTTPSMMPKNSAMQQSATQNRH